VYDRNLLLALRINFKKVIIYQVIEQWWSLPTSMFWFLTYSVQYKYVGPRFTQYDVYIQVYNTTYLNVCLHNIQQHVNTKINIIFQMHFTKSSHCSFLQTNGPYWFPTTGCKRDIWHPRKLDFWDSTLIYRRYITCNIPT